LYYGTDTGLVEGGTGKSQTAYLKPELKVAKYLLCAKSLTLLEIETKRHARISCVANYWRCIKYVR
jgi:hypothetical protein